MEPKPASTPSPFPSPKSERRRVWEVAAVFARLGFVAFGGPMAHVAIIEDEVVRRRGWVDRQHFLDLVAAVNFIPGPNSTELAIHLGFIRAGFPGLIAAGVCFISPAVLIILPLAHLYVRYGALPQVGPILGMVDAVILAIILHALIRFARSTLTTTFKAGIALAAAAAGFALSRRPEVQPELLILIGAAVGGCWKNLVGMIVPWQMRMCVAPVPLLAASQITYESRSFVIEFGPFATGMLSMGLLFLRVGATLFGSGYVLVNYLQTGLVDQHHWLTQPQLTNAIAVGQFTPGPLLTTATFAGYVIGALTFDGGTTGGVVGAILATVGIFAPSFVFVALLGNVLPRIRTNAMARHALDAMNAAVVALILVVSVRLVREMFSVAGGGSMDMLRVAVAGVSLAVLLIWELNATWLILAAVVVGVARYLVLR